MSAFGIDVNPEAVCIFDEPLSKHDVLDVLVAALSKTGIITNIDDFRKAVHEREAVMSTGIGSGVAIPHVRSTAVEEPAVGLGLSPAGVDYDTLDNQPVHIIVLFAMPAGSQKDYLGLLAQVMLAIKTEGFKERLLACTTTKEATDVVNDTEI